jgi:hypothetical protein
MPALRYWDGTAWATISNIPGPPGPQGNPGIDGQDGQATIIVGQFVTQTPATLPATGLIPAGWDGAGTFPGGKQMVVGEALIDNNPASAALGHLWQYVSTGVVPAGWIDVGLVRGPIGATGPTGPTGADGLPGPSFPGGTADQALTKIDSTDGNYQWDGPHLKLTGGTLTGHENINGANLYLNQNSTPAGGNLVAAGSATSILGRRLVAVNGGGGGNALVVIQFGYNGQGASAGGTGTYRHEIRAAHHGSQIGPNGLELWVHGSSLAPYSQISTDAPNNHVADFLGSLITFYKNVAAFTMTGELTFNGTNLGVTFTGGSRIYDWTDKPLTLMTGTGTAAGQPRIIGNNGLNARDIIDTVNGDARYLKPADATAAYVSKAGDTMTGTLVVSNGGVYIGDTWHGWRWDNAYNGEQLLSYQGKFGFYQSPGNVPGTLMYQMDTSALWLLGGRSLNNRTNSTTSGQTFNVHLVQDSGGTSLYEQKVLQYRGSGQWETEMQHVTSTNNGMNFWYKSWGGNAGAAQFYIYGQCSVGSLANRSDIKLKRNVIELAGDRVKEMFAKLRPVRYDRIGPTEDANGNPTTVPDKPEIGLVAQDVEAADPDLVSVDGDGMLAYEVGGVLALAIAEVKRLGALVDTLSAKVAALEAR